MTVSRPDVLSALPTLFDDAGEVDLTAFGLLCRHVEPVVDGAFVAGTTGEFPALERTERRALVETALEVFGPARTVVHVGAASTRQTVALTADAVAAGAARIAVLTPFYLPADTDAVLGHFEQVVRVAGEADVVAYLFPERSGVVLEPEGLARAVAALGLGGAKLSGAAAARLRDYMAAVPAGTRLWSGADTTLAEVVDAGAHGVVSGLSSAFPEPFADLADAIAAGDLDARDRAQARADAVLAALGGTVEGIKTALYHRHGCNPACRMPHPAVPDPEAIRELARTPVPR